MQKLRMRKVFVPGGLPKYTYVAREKLRLESRLRTANDNLCKLVTVTGPTKSGKSVLTQRVFPRTDAVWVDGGSVSQEMELWQQVVSATGAYTETEVIDSNEATSGISGEIKGEAGIPLMAKAEGSVKPSFSRGRAKSIGKSRSTPSKATALESLRASGRPFIIDDFHYLNRDIQVEVVRAIKALVFEGHSVVLLAIPHRKYDAIRVEKEMTGRVEQVEVPAWEPDELLNIPRIGFPLLKVECSAETENEFAEQALGSPHLMQEFCRQLCIDVEIEETLQKTRTINNLNMDSVFQRVAVDTSKTIFDRLAKGPRQRSDRNLRTFKDGTKGDIYVACLRAIAFLRPGMATLQYEEIRSALRDLLVDLPQAHEVSRVLEHMSKIQADEDASAPVIDWDKDERILHVTDPFFAFFLRWGLDSVSTEQG